MPLNTQSNKIQGYKVYNASSLGDFEEWVDNVKDKTNTTIYRGQKNNYSLLPNICREGEPESLLINERALLTAFKKEAPRCLQIVPETDIEWLVVAQHHGLHTRLLDWSFDPYVSLWFALQSSDLVSNPEVWVMNALKEDVITNKEKPRPFSGSRTKVFKSSFNLPRLRAQKGCFTVFKHIENSSKGFVGLERNQLMRKRISKVCIQTHNVKQIIGQLEAMGYNKDRLIPDIDEVASSIQSEILNKNRLNK